MTKDELKKKLAAVDEEATRKKRDVYAAYVGENAKYKAGDIITDGEDTIKVERISMNVYGELQVYIYYGGPKVKRNGEPVKSGRKAVVYESGAKLIESKK